MAANQTENYELNQWLATDQVLRTDFNADNAKLDAALADLAEDVSEKASQTALDALSSTVAGHTAALALTGNIQLHITTYVGTGTDGSDTPNMLTFQSAPFLVVITGGEENSWGVIAQKTGIMLRGGHLFTPQVSGGTSCPTTWAADGKSVTWFAPNSGAAGQFNYSETTYTVYTFLLMDME